MAIWEALRVATLSPFAAAAAIALSTTACQPEGKLAGDAAPELARVLGMVLGVCREARLPFGLGRGAGGARVPGAVDLLGDLERRVGPVERRARGGDFLVAERGAVDGFRARLVGRALADHGAAADERRTRAFGERLVDGRGDRGRIVAIHARDHVPAVGLEALRRVVAEPALDVPVDRDAVVVVEGDQLAQAQHPGERADLVGNSLHEAAVAEEHPGAVVDDLVPGMVEARREQLLGEREAHGVGEALAERPGGGLDAGRIADFRVSRRLRVQLAEAAQLLHRQVVAGEVQECVLQHGAVPVGEHEAVAIGPRRVRRVVAQVVPPEHLRDLRHAHRHPRMAGVGLLHRVHGERADGVDDVGVFSDGGESCRGGHGPFGWEATRGLFWEKT
jgi:hypothetical protein